MTTQLTEPARACFRRMIERLWRHDYSDALLVLLKPGFEIEPQFQDRDAIFLLGAYGLDMLDPHFTCPDFERGPMRVYFVNFIGGLRGKLTDDELQGYADDFGVYEQPPLTLAELSVLVDQCHVARWELVDAKESLIARGLLDTASPLCTTPAGRRCLDRALAATAFRQAHGPQTEASPD